MSYRAPGATDGEWWRKVQQDIRYLYKCCEKVSTFEVIAANHSEFWTPNHLSQRWYPPFGEASLLEVFASVHQDFPVTPLDDTTHVIEVWKNGAAIASLTLNPATGTGEVTGLSEPFGPDDYLQYLIDYADNGSGGMLVVQGLMAGSARGSAGMNFYDLTPPA